jgi:protein-serine/threonine kinase
VRGFATRSGVEDSVDASAIPHILIPKSSNDGPLRSTLSTMNFNSQHSVSPGSALSSPALAAMTDITPLPSPLLPEDSPGSWKAKFSKRSGSTGSLKSVKEHLAEDFTPSASGVPRASSKKRLPSYSNLSLLGTGALAESAGIPVDSRQRRHSRHRSLSDQIAEPLHNVRPRTTTLSTATMRPEDAAENAPPLHREVYLAERRGLVQPHPPTQSRSQPPIPTPPPSNRSTTGSEGDDALGSAQKEQEENLESASSDTVGRALVVKDATQNQEFKYRVVRPLGQGTFSKVVLATSESLPLPFEFNETSEAKLDKKQLVAIKIIDHGPAGGADEERVELSLKREIEIMQSVRHPSLIHLMAYDLHSGGSGGQALLVLNYCAGGDLFDLASEHADAITPVIVQRIFAELASAVGYLHENRIVHRDIKLESTHEINHFDVQRLTICRCPGQHPLKGTHRNI